MTVACPDDTPATVVSQYASRWATKGVQVQIVRYLPDQGPQAGPPADLWIVEPCQMPRFAAAGALLPVPEDYLSSVGYSWTDLLPLYRHKLLIWDGRAYALPVLGDVLLCFWRADLLADPRHRMAFQNKFGRDLASPATWQDYGAIAAYFHENLPLGKSRAPLPPLSLEAEAMEQEFYAVAAPFARRAIGEDEKQLGLEELFAFHFDLETGQPRIGGPGFVAALRLLQRLQNYRPAKPAEEPAAAFANGDAVLCLAHPRWISRFQKSSIGGKFGIGRVPGSRQFFGSKGEAGEGPAGNYVPYLGSGGWLGVVPKQTTNAEHAFALLAFLGDPKLSLDIVVEPAWGGGAFRREHIDRPGWQSFELDDRQRPALSEALRQTLVHPRMINPVIRLRVPNERAYQLALVRQLRACLLEGKTPAEALNTAAADWQKLNEEHGAKKAFDEYRLSLGLLPK